MTMTITTHFSLSFFFLLAAASIGVEVFMPGDVDTSGSDLEIRLSSPKRPDRLPTFVYFLSICLLLFSRNNNQKNVSI